MRRIVITLVAGLFGVLGAMAQKVYSTDHGYQADVKVFVVDNEYRADLIVFRTDKSYRAKADENKGIWFFTDKEYRAGWQKKDKKQLMY